MNDSNCWVSRHFKYPLDSRSATVGIGRAVQNRQTTANTQGVCGRIRFQHVVVYRMAGLTHGKCGLHACGVWSVTDWA